VDLEFVRLVQDHLTMGNLESSLADLQPEYLTVFRTELPQKATALLFGTNATEVLNEPLSGGSIPVPHRANVLPLELAVFGRSIGAVSRDQTLFDWGRVRTLFILCSMIRV
jgi:hypothetical protein